MSTPSTFSIIKTGFMGVTGLGYTVILPILIGAIVDQLQLDRSMVGWITFSNICGLALGGLLATVLIGKVSLLKMIRIACIILIIFDLISAFCATANSLIGFRFLSGLGGGVLYASSLASFSALKDSIRAFGIYIVSYAFISGVTLFILPYFIEPYGFKIGFFTLAGMAVISLIVSNVVTKFESNLSAKDFSSLPLLLKNKYVLLSLISYFLLQMGGGVVYTYIERIAKEAGQAVEFIGLVLSLGAVLSVAGALLVIKMGNRFSPKWPVIFGIILMAVSMAALFHSENAIWFLFGNCMIGGFWSTLIPFYQQLQGRFDPFGRIVTVGTVVNMAGRAMGPAVAATFLGDYAFKMVIWLALACLLIALVLIIPILLQKDEPTGLS